MDIQQAIDGPRFFFEGEQVLVESGTRTGDHRRADCARPHGGQSGIALGRAQAIRIHWDRGVLIGGSDLRKGSAWRSATESRSGIYSVKSGPLPARVKTPTVYSLNSRP